MLLALKVRYVSCTGFIEHHHLPEALQRVKIERKKKKTHESKPKLMIRLFCDELSVSLPVQLAALHKWSVEHLIWTSAQNKKMGNLWSPLELLSRVTPRFFAVHLTLPVIEPRKESVARLCECVLLLLN